MDADSRTADRIIDATAGRVTEGIFGVAALLRRARAFHPNGRAFAATIDVTGVMGAGTVLSRPGRSTGVVRLSRALGMPEPMPDGLGFALRLNGSGSGSESQDLLLVSSADEPIGRRVVVPARHYGAAFYSSLVPFQAGDRRVLFGVRPVWQGVPTPTARIDDVREAADAGLLTFELLVRQESAPWKVAANIVLGSELPASESAELRFTPYHCAGGIEPTGWVNVLRRRAYAASQRARTESR